MLRESVNVRMHMIYLVFLRALIPLIPKFLICVALFWLRYLRTPVFKQMISKSRCLGPFLRTFLYDLSDTSKAALYILIIWHWMKSTQLWNPVLLICYKKRTQTAIKMFRTDFSWRQRGRDREWMSVERERSKSPQLSAGTKLISQKTNWATHPSLGGLAPLHS